MQTVWKYPLKIEDRQVIDIPHLSSSINVLHIDVVDGDIYMWCEVDPDNPPVETTILCFGTGHPILWSDLKHLGTVINNGFVWHFYTPSDNKECEPNGNRT